MNYRPIAAIGAALVAGALAAVLTPRLTDTEDINWIITIVAALVVGALVAVLLRERVDGDA